MASFYVEPAQLAGLVKLLERLGEDARAGDRYVLGNTGMAGGEGWLNDLSGAHESVVDHTRQWLEALYDPAASKFAGAVGRAVTYYLQTDQAEAERLDAAARSYSGLLDLPNPGTDYWVRHAGVGAFDDVNEPEEAYRTPPDYNDHEEFRYQPSYWDVVSVASLGRDAIFKATEFLASMGMLDRAYDPYELVLKPVVGDWAGFRRAADVYRNVAEALTYMSIILYHARVSLPSVWRGTAADGCNVHIGRLSSGILEGHGPLHLIADEYEKAAQGQADFRHAVAQLISDLIDAAVILVVAVAAGGATSWTGVGAVVGGLVGIVEAGMIVRIIHEILGWRGRIDAIINAVQSSMNNFGQLQASDFYLPKLPEVDGDHSTLDALPS